MRYLVWQIAFVLLVGGMLLTVEADGEEASDPCIEQVLESILQELNDCLNATLVEAEEILYTLLIEEVLNFWNVVLEKYSDFQEVVLEIIWNFYNQILQKIKEFKDCIVQAFTECLNIFIQKLKNFLWTIYNRIIDCFIKAYKCYKYCEDYCKWQEERKQSELQYLIEQCNCWLTFPDDDQRRQACLLKAYLDFIIRNHLIDAAHPLRHMCPEAKRRPKPKVPEYDCPYINVTQTNETSTASTAKPTSSSVKPTTYTVKPTTSTVKPTTSTVKPTSFTAEPTSKKYTAATTKQTTLFQLLNTTTV